MANDITVSDLIMSLIVGAICGAIFIQAICVTPVRGNMEELGDAICSEKYNATFESYQDGVLECSSGLVDDYSYDGLRVRISEVEHGS